MSARRLLVPAVAIVACACDINLISSTDGGPDARVPDGAIVVPTGGGGPCLADGGVDDQCPSQGLLCCQTTCVNTSNDPQNCGGCGNTCSGLSPMCHQGACAPSRCMPACASGETCCDLPTPASGSPRCALGSTCPVACPPCG